MPALTPSSTPEARPQQPSPFRLFQAINAFHLTDAIRSAIELDIFTAIGSGRSTPAAIARQCSVAERGARILCDFLVVSGFLTKSGQEYSLAADTAMFLDRNSPAYIGTCTRFLLNDPLRKQFLSLPDAVRQGGATDHMAIDPESPVWVEFARSMAPMMIMASQELAKLVVRDRTRPMNVLDIAAGHGLFGIAVLRANANAKVTAVDWKNVLEVARENAEKFGVADRYTTLPGSIFDVEIGSGYDLVLIPNFLHHFDVATNEKLLRKLYAGLVPGGMVATLEFVPNEDRISPPMPATFALIMLAETPSGDAYTRTELESMLGNSGFVDHEFHPMPPSPHSVLISRRGSGSNV
ncbi:MAG TPA: class I SAM-dependent methyltransferase [Candidatus Acidoferrum sp.]|nr:class I SAM-dependent methyltransferase [Candidatus Acidoferrum sp.]